MKSFILFCFLLTPFFATTQIIYTVGSTHPTEFACENDYVSFPDGIRMFTGLIISQGKRMYYLDYPYTFQFVYPNSLTFTDLDSYPDQVTVKFNNTYYNSMLEFVAAVASYNCGAGGSAIDSITYSGDTLRIFEEGVEFKAEIVGGGSASIIVVTYAEMDSLISNNLLAEGQFYNITDASGTDLGFITQAVKDNEITMTGTGGYLNADFQAVGDYSGVVGITGIAAGTQLGIWTVGKDSTLTTGDIVIWNLKHWQCLEDTLTDGTDPVTNTAGYQELLKTDTNQGYIEEWDVSEFDFTNEWLQYRADSRGNKYRYSFSTDIVFGLGHTGILDFQWGNDGWYSNVANEGSILGKNILGGIYNNVLDKNATINNNVLDQSAIIKGNIMGAGSYINNNRLKQNASISNNILDQYASFDNNVLEQDAYINGNILDIGTAVNYNILAQYASFGGNITGVGSYINNNTLDQYAYFANNVLEQNAFIANNVLEQNAFIENNRLEQNASLQDKDTLVIGQGIITNNIGSFFHIPVNSFGFSNKKVGIGFSNFSDTLDISGLDTLDLAGYDYVGIFYLTSTNATDTLTQITNFPTAFPFTLRPGPGLAVTFTATSISSAVAGDIVLPAASFTADGDKQDWIEFEVDDGGVGFVKYRNGVNNY